MADHDPNLVTSKPDRLRLTIIGAAVFIMVLTFGLYGESVTGRLHVSTMKALHTMLPGRPEH